MATSDKGPTIRDRLLRLMQNTPLSVSLLDAFERESGIKAAQQAIDAIRNRLDELQLEIDSAKVQP